MKKITVAIPNPMLTAGGEPFHVNCYRCGEFKSSTCASIVKEMPWKYFCQHCIICVMMDEAATGTIIEYEGPDGVVSRYPH